MTYQKVSSLSLRIYFGGRVMGKFKCKTRIFGNYKVVISHRDCEHLKRSKSEFKKRYPVIVEIIYLNKSLSKISLNSISLVTSNGVNEKDAVHKAIKALRNQRYAWSVQNCDYAYQRYFLERKIKHHSMLKLKHEAAEATEANLKYVNHNIRKISCLSHQLNLIKDT